MEGIQVSIDKIENQEDIYLVKVGGYVDTTTSIELEDVIEKLIKTNVKKIIIDLGAVDYISSAGWGIFISEIKSIREKGGDLKLVRMVPDVYEVFELLEFHNILEAYDSVGEAIDDFRREVLIEEFDDQAESGIVKSDTDESSIKIATSPIQALQGMMEAKKAPAAEQDLSALSIDEKIKTVARENPEFNTREIRNTLDGERFGNVKINWLELRRRLKALGLDSMRKRVIYARKNM
ncbi:MAG: STAS domain-containing protein [Candidatus Glassbacteria bacterium]